MRVEFIFHPVHDLPGGPLRTEDVMVPFEFKRRFFQQRMPAPLSDLAAPLRPVRLAHLRQSTQNPAAGPVEQHRVSHSSAPDVDWRKSAIRV